MKSGNILFKASCIVAFVVVCVAVSAYLYTKAGGVIRTKTPYTVQAVLPDALNLVKQSDVRMGGHLVGRVVERGNTGGMALITLEIQDQYVPIYRDARLLPRIKTLVGETYLDIDPGKPKAGPVPNNGTLSAVNADEVSPLERFLSIPNPNKTIQDTYRGVGFGLDGHGGDVNRLFESARPTVADGGRFMQAVRGQRQQLAQTVDQTATVMQAFADRTQQIRSLAYDAKHTAEVVAARDESLREIFTELEPTLKQARTSTTKLGDFSGRATPVMRDLSAAMVDLYPTLVDLKPAASDGRRLFAKLPGFISATDPLLDDLRGFTQRFKPAVNSLDTLLRQTNPAVDYAKDFDRDFAAFWANNGSINNVYDAQGALGRVFVIEGPNSFDFFNTPAFMPFREGFDFLVNNGLIGIAEDQKRNPYPKPGTVGKPDTSSSFRPIEAEPAGDGDGDGGGG